MRWQALFADLESQLAAAQERDHLAEVPDRTRAERAGVALVDRLRGHGSGRLTLTVLGGERLEGRAVEVGPQWVLLADDQREHLVPLAAVAAVAGLCEAAVPARGVVASRLTLGHALRAVARDRAVVRVHTGGGTFAGRVDAVGADHLDVAMARDDTGRPTGERRLVPWSALLVVSRL